MIMQKVLVFITVVADRVSDSEDCYVFVIISPYGSMGVFSLLCVFCLFLVAKPMPVCQNIELSTEV